MRHAQRSRTRDAAGDSAAVHGRRPRLRSVLRVGRSARRAAIPTRSPAARLHRLDRTVPDSTDPLRTREVQRAAGRPPAAQALQRTHRDPRSPRTTSVRAHPARRQPMTATITSELGYNAPIGNARLLDGVREVAELTTPDRIVGCDGSDAEWDRMTACLVEAVRSSSSMRPAGVAASRPARTGLIRPSRLPHHPSRASSLTCRSGAPAPREKRCRTRRWTSSELAAVAAAAGGRVDRDHDRATSRSRHAHRQSSEPRRALGFRHRRPRRDDDDRKGPRDAAVTGTSRPGLRQAHAG